MTQRLRFGNSCGLIRAKRAATHLSRGQGRSGRLFIQAQSVSFAFVVCCVLLLTSPFMCFSQSGATGTIVGTVTDTSGAVIPDAVVSVISVGTNVRQNTVTSASGTYSVPSLLPGSYKVAVNKAGFENELVSGIELFVGKKATVDVRLRPGSVSQSVNVTATTVNLDTENAAVGTDINQQEVTDLPLNGRNFTELLTLEAGATVNSGEQGVYRANEGNAYSIQGGRPGSNQYTLDGVSVSDEYYQTPNLIPSIDVLQEFQEQTKGYSAAYGGGENQINLSTKSGTNQLHGTAYDFLRNNDLDAYGYAFAYPLLPTPSLHQNQFGYSLGGPVWIPKLYDGRNKTFFFANYEGLRVASSSNALAIVPTSSELGIGNPAPYTNDALIPSSTPIIDPSTGNPFATDGNGNYIIPQGDFSAFANNAIPHFPTPNQANNPSGNYAFSAASPQNANQQTYRIDVHIGDKHTFFSRYTQTDYGITEPGVTSEGNSILSEPTHQVMASYTRTFSPTLVNQARFGYTYETVLLDGKAIPESEWTSIGLTGLFPYNQYTTYPLVSLSGFSTVGGAAYAPQIFEQPVFQGSDTLSMVKGSHNLSTGIDIIHTENYVNTFSSPKLTYNGPVAGITENTIADFLLGWAQTANAQEPTQFATTPANANSDDFWYTRIAPWVEDDWKVNPRLTVNMGLRWDFMPLPYDSRGNLFWIDPNIPGGGLYTAAKYLITDGIGGSLYAYEGPNPGPQQWKVFAPRVGAAFRPFRDGKTVLRAGWGLFYDSDEIKESFAGGEYPFGEQAVFYNVNTSTLFPSEPPFSPVTPADLGFVWAEDKYVPPYVESWTASVEREVGPGVKLEADYLGSQAHHLTGRSWRSAPTPYDPNNPSPASARLPYPNLPTILDHPFEYASNYNALELKAEHESHDLTFLASYTWSHSLDDKSSDAGINGDTSGNGPMDEYNWRLDYSTSSFDIQQRFVGSLVYPLPFGKSKYLLGNANKVTDLLIGGWQSNGILTLQSGQPFSIGASDVNFINEVYGQRANIVGNPNSGAAVSANPTCQAPRAIHTLAAWFNPCAFVNPGLGQFGNSGRDSLRGPHYTNLDFSLFKNVPLGERVTWQTRAEAFNAFNHTNLGNPNNAVYVGAPYFGAIGSAGAGRILQVAMKVIW